MLNSKSTLNNIFWRFSERILAQLVTTVVSIVLARILMPSDYGVLSVIMIFINMCNLLVTHGFSSALIQKKDADNIDFSTAFFSNIIFTIVLYLLLFFLAPVIADYFDIPILTPVLRVMGLRIPLTAINSIQSAYVSKNLQFKKFFWATLTGTVISAIVGVLMALNGFGAWALVGQYLTNTFIDTIFLWFTVKWRPQLVFSWRRAKGMLRYGWKILLSAVLDDVSVEAKSFLIGKKYSSTDLAFYSKGKEFPTVINTNVNESISSVLFPMMALKQNDDVQFKNYFKRALKLSTFVMFPMLFGLAAISDEFILVLLTEKWMEAAPYLRIMCFCFLFTPIYSANVQAMKAKGRSDRFLYFTIIKFILNITACFVFMQYGVYWIALGGLFATAISTMLYVLQNKKISGYGVFEQLFDIAPNLILAATMCLVVYFIGRVVVCGNFVLLLIKIAAGIIFYVCMALLFKFKAVDMIKEHFKRVKKGDQE